MNVKDGLAMKETKEERQKREYEEEYKRIYEKYKTKDDNFLRNIIADDSYTPEAKQAAQDILNSDRTEFYQEEEKQRLEREEIVQKNKELYDSRKSNPLYEDIHQIAGDIRFIKNLIIFGIVVAVLFGLYMGIKF